MPTQPPYHIPSEQDRVRESKIGKSYGSRLYHFNKAKVQVTHIEAEGNKRYYSLLPTSKPCPNYSSEASVYIEVAQEDKQ